MAEEIKPRQVRCPQCGRLAFFSSENPDRPFCSERCRLIDLGDWASENFKIPTADASAVEQLSQNTDEDSD